MLVHIIADYGMGDLAFAEVVQRIQGASARHRTGVDSGAGLLHNRSWILYRTAWPAPFTTRHTDLS